MKTKRQLQSRIQSVDDDWHTSSSRVPIMVRYLALVAALCAPLPAAAQSSRVYTNADLGQKTVTWQKTVTPEEWAGIVARRFIPPPPVPIWGPSVYVLPRTNDAISATPSVFGSSSSADALWSDPVTAYALQHPIEAADGFGHRGARVSRTPRADFQPPVPPTVRVAPRESTPPAPAIVTTAASAGRRVR
jgi:hypothetical protein